MTTVIAWCAALTVVALVVRPLLLRAVSDRCDAAEAIAFLPDRAAAVIACAKEERLVATATRFVHAALSAVTGGALLFAGRAGYPAASRRLLSRAGAAFSFFAVPLFLRLTPFAPVERTFSFIGLLLGVLAVSGTASLMARAAIALMVVDAVVSELARAGDIGAITTLPWLDFVTAALLALTAFAARRSAREGLHSPSG